MPVIPDLGTNPAVLCIIRNALELAPTRLLRCLTGRTAPILTE